MGPRPPFHRLLRIERGGQWQAAVTEAGSNIEKVVPIFSEAGTRFNRERAKTQSINLPYFLKKYCLYIGVHFSI